MKRQIGILLLLTVSLSAWANEENFEKNKQQAIQNVEERINDLQTLKSCMAGTHDHDGMKHCREENEKRMKELQMKNAENRKQRLDENIKRLQDEKSKLDQKTKH
jgi:hypothetical protein